MIITYKDMNWSTIGFLDKSENYLSKVNSSLIVMFHGFAGNKTGYRRSFVNFTTKAIENNFSVLRFDLPGEGESIVVNKNINHGVMIKEFINKIRHDNQFNNLIFIGHCKGGSLAMEIASDFPSIESIILWDMYETVSIEIEGGEDSKNILNKYRKKILLKETWRKLLQMKINWTMFFAVLARAIHPNKRLTRKIPPSVHSTKKNIIKSRAGTKLLCVHDSTRKEYKRALQICQRNYENQGYNVKNVVIPHKQFSPDWQQEVFNNTIGFLQSGRKLSTYTELSSTQII